MKPRRILLFLAILAAFLFPAALLFPDEGIEILPGWVISFHYNPFELTENQNNNIVNDIIETFAADTVETANISDSLTNGIIDSSLVKKTKRKAQQIEMQDSNHDMFDVFFNKLQSCKQTRVRILHFGDSQIEGDRITGYLRNKFQKRFGGSGPGLMPAIPEMAESSSIMHKTSSNWIKHAAYYKRDTILPHSKFGPMGRFSRFTEYKDDSVKSTLITKAFIEFRKSGLAYSSVQSFTSCRVFYNHVNAPCIVKGLVNDSLVWFEELDNTQQESVFEWNFSSPPNRFRIEFESTKSPDIYSIALDSSSGVAIDNLPFRGSSGTEFTKINANHLKHFAKELNAGLIILQFGVNIVPHITKSYQYYQQAMVRQIKYIKRIYPDAVVLVIGVSDMSQKKGDEFISYPNIEKIRDAQKKAAFETESCFWDLYQAMGGKNSMSGWVNANPSLAQKDFIHFNRNGGHIVAQMLFDAIMTEYRQFLDKQNIAGNANY